VFKGESFEKAATSTSPNPKGAELEHLKEQDFHTLSSNHFRPFLFDSVLPDLLNANGRLLYCDLMIFNAIRHHRHHLVF
jgi:hypothetical protein